MDGSFGLLRRLHARANRLATTSASAPAKPVSLTRKSPFLLAMYALFAGLAAPQGFADEAQWVWASGTLAEHAIPAGETCFFRKLINLRTPAEGVIEIAADDRYELFVNGKRVGGGVSPREMQEFDVSKLLTVGRNMVAVRVSNTHGDTAALAARVSVRPINQEKWYTFSSDKTWKTTLDQSSMWQSTVFNDRVWKPAAEFGPLGDTVPWDQDEDVVAETQTEQKERFQIQRGFGVQRVLGDEDVGSVIAMAFNEFGHIILSQEGGPLLLVHDKDDDGVPESVRTYCDLVESVQGILPLNGDVFVTGKGPDGSALYKLTDADRNGELESIETVLKFKGDGGEHGPHGLRLGPDGMIYIAVGSHVKPQGKIGKGDTLGVSYEGDLLPRQHDPGGHGRGIKAPGGTIIRTTTDGKFYETVAGGLRNVYDFVFHPSGGLFAHDADMEADVDTAWYRPTAMLDVTEGSEFGWRPGWAKWPDHYIDRVPSLLDTGRGSPTGAACYEHYMFPVRYHNSIFLADWSEGRILNVRLKERGAGYIADSEVFLKGQPLNVTDLEVGPDGGLYFCTGGRGTAGGVYRVVYKGEIPDRMKQLGTGIAAAVRQPQMGTAWTRQEIASIKRELGDEWGQLVAGVAYSNDNPAHYRTRAMDLMHLFGPVPSDELLLELSKAPNEQVRAKAATLLGLHPSKTAAVRLTRMLEDRNARVQRSVCEAILRSRQFPETPDELLTLVASDDRMLAYSARRVLEQMPSEQWRDEVLQTSNARLAIVGMLALVNADTTEATALKVVNRASELMEGFLSDADFVDTLRLCQVALHRGKIYHAKATGLRDQIAAEFPAGDPRMNIELIKLAVYLQADSVAQRGIEFLDSDARPEDKALVGMCLQQLDHKWTAEERFRILKFYEQTARAETTGSLSMYIMNTTRQFASVLSDTDIKAIIDEGAVWRNAALAAIFRLPRPINADTTEKLIDLDSELQQEDKVGDLERRLRTGIIAMLSTSSQPEAERHLRKIWRTEPDRREVVAYALSQKPDGENWDYLVRSLNILEPQSAEIIVGALRKVPAATDDPMALRQLILLGVRSESDGKSFENVEKLLEHWTGMERPKGGEKSMKLWQKWYAKSYPDRPAAELPDEQSSRWDFDQLLTFLDSESGKFGDMTAGHAAFVKAKCDACHRNGSVGQSIGPDLTNIASRFTRREIVESILFPSHVVSDQYASKKVLSLDGRVVTGIVSDLAGGGLEVRDSNNDVTRIEANDIDQILPSKTSVMPSGLLDSLTMREIRDLMSFINVIPPLEIAEQPADSQRK